MGRVCEKLSHEKAKEEIAGMMRITVMLSNDLHDDLARLCMATKVTRGYFIRKALEMYLPTLGVSGITKSSNVTKMFREEYKKAKEQLYGK